MKLTSIAACLGLAIASGCSVGVKRATPTELRDAPGSVLSFDSNRPYSTAYRKTLEQMTACYARKAFTVTGDQASNESQVSLGSSSTFAHRVYSTVVLKPNGDGTTVTIFWATANPPVSLRNNLQKWLDSDATGCPGDIGFNDQLEK